ncbi:hypothetical protein [Deinococcus misasensis]|uniref:hypothetical protein n=1 Tax=Deinococcus misasensis TaxID=392413 RepID=UPI0005522AF6|nr:hypothetical protein [Deinococcus misasensis]
MSLERQENIKLLMALRKPKKTNDLLLELCLTKTQLQERILPLWLSGFVGRTTTDEGHKAQFKYHLTEIGLKYLVSAGKVKPAPPPLRLPAKPSATGSHHEG